VTLPRRFAWLVVSMVALVPVVAGCGRTGDPSTVPALGGSMPAESAVAIESAPPAASIEPSGLAFPSVEPDVPEPPAAEIAVEGGDPVVGELGSFSWNNIGSSSPGLDGAPIHVGAGEPVTLTLAAPIGIAGWQVSRVRPGNHDWVGAVSMGSGSAMPVLFEAPPTGTWSVEVRVVFSGHLGSAAYYWRFQVD
jgi:hypothetical protein